ncbi:MAG TPA: hypothetical protein VFI16_05085, partial [Anaeromyxobacteraceae bacterium]|nr:hypothetical protein [Anaeromyxobacteraceae bacterium]
EAQLKPATGEQTKKEQKRDGTALQNEKEKEKEDQEEKAAEEAAKKRRARLAAFADKVVQGARAIPQRYSDVDTLVMVANYAAAMTNDPGQYVNDMGAVLAGGSRRCTCPRPGLWPPPPAFCEPKELRGGGTKTERP